MSNRSGMECSQRKIDALWEYAKHQIDFTTHDVVEELGWGMNVASAWISHLARAGKIERVGEEHLQHYRPSINRDVLNGRKTTIWRAKKRNQ